MNYSAESSDQGRPEQGPSRADGRSPSRVRGRRPGQSGVRDHVLAIAARRFPADGYQGVTLRSIAAEADVDVALISYYFGSKRGLFTASLTLPASPFDLLRQTIPGDPATLPERILRTLIETWDDPGRGGPLRTLLSAGIAEPDFGRVISEVITREIVDVIADHLGGAQAHRRAAAAATQLSGLIFARYLLPYEPIASMPADELARTLAPGLRPALQPPRVRPRG